MYYDAKYICPADIEMALLNDNSILILEGLDCQIIDGSTRMDYNGNWVQGRRVQSRNKRV